MTRRRCPPRRLRRIGTSALVLLFVLAGCSGTLADGAGTPTRSVTPAPVPTDRPDVAPLPPGVSIDGVIDAERLEAAHLAALANTTFEERARTVVRFENGSLAVEETYVGRHGRTATNLSLRRRGAAEYGVPDRSLVAADVWGNASFGVRRFVTAQGRVELGAFEGTRLFYRRPRGGYGLALREANTSLRFRRVVDGSTEYLVVAAEGVDPNGPWYFRRTFMRTRGEGRARVVLAPNGTIRRFVAEFPVRIAGRNATLRHVYTAERRDLTVSRPAWFDEATVGRTPGPRSLAGGDRFGSDSGPRSDPGLSLDRRPSDGSPGVRSTGRQVGPSAPGSTWTTSGAPVGA